MAKEYFNYWLDINKNNLSFTTLYGYKNIINNHLVPYFKNIDIADLTPIIINQYYQYKINEGLNVNTVRKHHDLLKTILKNAVFEMVITFNSCERTIPPRKQKANINYYDVEMLKILLKKAFYSDLKLVIYIGAFLGLRRGEMCGLTWDNIDFNNHTLEINKSMVSGGNVTRIKEPKNKTSSRILFIPNILEKMLFIEYQRQQHIKGVKKDYNPSNYVLVGKNGLPHHPNYLSTQFNKFIKENYLPPLTLHGLRHTFATVSNQAGVSLFDISKALGHSTPSVTGKIYTHITKETHKTAVQAVDYFIRFGKSK